MTEPEPTVCLYTSDEAPEDMESFKIFLKKIAKGVRDDYHLTNAHTFGKGAKFGSGLLAASYFAKETGTLTPMAWAVKRFGPLPLEFTKSGSLQIFTYTAFQRFLLIAGATAAKFVTVAIVFKGGVAIGSVTNQFLSQEVKDAIGGTIYNWWNTIYGIICEEGWKDLWRHPFGYGIFFGPKGERLINY